jgi:hypothetical protein
VYNININNIWLQKHIKSVVATIAYTKHTKSIVKTFGCRSAQNQQHECLLAKTHKNNSNTIEL